MKGGELTCAHCVLTLLCCRSRPSTHAHSRPAASHLHPEQHCRLSGQRAPPPHRQHRTHTPPPPPHYPPPSSLLLLLLTSQSCSQPPHLLLQRLPRRQLSGQERLLFRERPQAAVGMSQCAGQQGTGQQEGGRLPAAPREEALELGEVGGQRGGVELQRGGVIAEGVTLRATLLKQRQRGKIFIL